MKKSIFAIICTALIISIMWFFSPNNSKESVYEVETTLPQRKNIYDYINAAGRIKEGNRRDIYPDSIINVTKVCVKTGDKVKKGDILAEFKNPNFDGVDISGYENAAEKVISVFEEYGFELADGTDITKFAETASTEDCHILSPIDGIVTSVCVKDGGRATPLSKIFSVSDFDELYVSAMVPEGYSSKVEKGQKVEISSDAFDTKKYRGVVTELSPVAKRQNSLMTGQGETYIEALVNIENIDKLIKPELSVNAKISANVVTSALTIPYNCVLQDEENREFVYVVEDNCAKKRFVYLGYELDNETEVKGGLTDDTLVILNPVAEMENAKIKLKG